MYNWSFDHYLTLGRMGQINARKNSLAQSHEEKSKMANAPRIWEGKADFLQWFFENYLVYLLVICFEQPYWGKINDPTLWQVEIPVLGGECKI